jgi:hypothetical protein
MPKLGEMAQLSRPFQIALIALGVLVLAWFAVLHRPGGSSTSSSSPSVSSSASSAAHSSGSAANGSGAAKSSSVYHGSAPGLEGLTRDVHRAHGAAAEVESNGREVQGKAVQGTGEAASGGTPAAASHSTAGAHTGTGAHPGVRAGSSAGTSASASAAAGSRAAAAGSHAQRHTHASSGAATTATAALTLHHLTEALHLNFVVDLVEAIDPGLGLKAKVAHAEDTLVARMKSDLQPTPPATIAAELHQGKTVLLLFLNPHSYDDDATAIDTTEVAYKLRHHVVAHLALADQVNSFGSITRNIQVYQTPTLLIINPKLQVTTLTGLTDGFSIEQAVAEARK